MQFSILVSIVLPIALNADDVSAFTNIDAIMGGVAEIEVVNGKNSVVLVGDFPELKFCEGSGNAPVDGTPGGEAACCIKFIYDEPTAPITPTSTTPQLKGANCKSNSGRRKLTECPSGTFDVAHACQDFGFWCHEDGSVVSGCVNCDLCDFPSTCPGCHNERRSLDSVQKTYVVLVDHVTCKLTVDNILHQVLYDGNELEVLGDKNDWHAVKTFSFKPKPGAVLSISGEEVGDCPGCECAGLQMHCENGFNSDTSGWTAIGTDTLPSLGYNAPIGFYSSVCESTSGFSLSGEKGDAKKIWAHNGKKFAWFRAVPVKAIDVSGKMKIKIEAANSLVLIGRFPKLKMCEGSGNHPVGDTQGGEVVCCVVLATKPRVKGESCVATQGRRNLNGLCPDGSFDIERACRESADWCHQTEGALDTCLGCNNCVDPKTCPECTKKELKI